MEDRKLTSLPPSGAALTSDLLYTVRAGASYRASVGQLPFVLKAGGTMTGPLTLSYNGTALRADNGAQYLDFGVSGAPFLQARSADGNSAPLLFFGGGDYGEYGRFTTSGALRMQSPTSGQIPTLISLKAGTSQENEGAAIEMAGYYSAARLMGYTPLAVASAAGIFEIDTWSSSGAWFTTAVFSKDNSYFKSGKVGIGTDNSDSALHVSSPNASLRIGFNGLGENYYDANNQFFRSTDGTLRMSLTSVGLAVPDKPVSGQLIRAENDVRRIELGWDGTNNYLQSYNSANSSALGLAFYTGTGVRTIIQTNGNLRHFGGAEFGDNGNTTTTFVTSSDNFPLGFKKGTGTGAFYLGATEEAQPSLIFSRNDGTTVAAVQPTGDFAPARGIAFPATQIPASDANVLDDYEEGTYTPVVTMGSSVVTYAARTGRYTKIGRLVTAEFDIVLSSRGASYTSQAVVVSFPFTPAIGGSAPVTILSGTFVAPRFAWGGTVAAATIFEGTGNSAVADNFEDGSRLLGTVTFSV